MFGTSSNRKCGLHGAETVSFVAFLTAFLEEHSHKLAGRGVVHVAAGQALSAMVGIIREYPRDVPIGKRGVFCSMVQQYLASMQDLGVARRAKDHMLVNLTEAPRGQGPPALAACWADQSRNFQLKRLCVEAHRCVWHARVLSSWIAMEGHAEIVHVRKARRL